MSLYLILQVSDVLIYPDIIVSGSIRTIRQVLMTFNKPGTCGE